MKILFAYDGSEGATAAISAASKILAHDGAEAVVLSVWEPLTVQALHAITYGGPLAMPLDVAEADRESARQAQELAERGAQLARENGFDASARSVADTDRIAHTVVATADEVGSDVIVVGARGLTGVRALMGSVSNHVVRHSDRAVLVVPSKPEH